MDIFMNQNQQSAFQDVLELLHTNFSTYETAAEYQNTTKGRKTHEGDSPEKVRSKEFLGPRGPHGIPPLVSPLARKKKLDHIYTGI